MRQDVTRLPLCAAAASALEHADACSEAMGGENQLAEGIALANMKVHDACYGPSQATHSER